jgi:hypothetical protein
MEHDWTPSTVGHGEAMCARCKITNREAGALGEDQCPGTFEVPTLDPVPPTPTAADLPEGEYAIAEIMGHSTMIGRYAEVERFGTKMLSLEPIWENKLLPAVFVGGSSLYRFTPCSREVAFTRQPKHRYQLPPAVTATLPPEPPAALAAPEPEDELGDQFEDADF